MSPKQEIRRMEAVVKHYMAMTPAGREWVSSWLASRDHETGQPKATRGLK